MAIIPGTPGDDILYGTDDPDTITGIGGNDRLFGFGGNDLLDGGDNSDILDGGTGADTMSAGLGDDFYVVDDAGDIVTEALGAARISSSPRSTTRCRPMSSGWRFTAARACSR